ncbi:MAG: T9SS type B sorting domain-containing protein, partial [Bacteroidota bacterium]
NQAFVATVLALAGHGDHILMMRPCYFNHESTLGMLGVGIDYVDCGCTKFVPNVFTPNQDGIHDRWEVQLSPGIKALQLVVFDRWGRELFSSNRPNDWWDGTFNGKAAPVGVYFYRLSYQCFDQAVYEMVDRTGHVSLIR